MNAPQSADEACKALDLLADLRLRTAPHTGEARRLNTELRSAFQIKRPADALNAWEVALQGAPGDERIHQAVMEWSLALGLHAAINFEDARASRRLVNGLASSLPILESRTGAIYAWARRGREVTEALAGLVGRSPLMDALRTQTWRAVFTDDVRKALALRAPHRLSVLITGEPGTGKEIVARTIAAGRGRTTGGPQAKPGEDQPGPYLAVNIASLTPSLASSDLFGHVRGAFTGSTGERDGLFVAASGGVLFLDEVGDASPEVQVRLLRTLQEGTVRPVGGDRERKVSVRVLAATNLDLTDPNSKFRRDLLERLSVLRVDCPPLRGRVEDIPELVRHFVAEEIDDSAWPAIVDDVLGRLQTETADHAWPGNVRELRAATNRVLAGQPALLPGRAARPGRGADDLAQALVDDWGVIPLEDVKHLYAAAALESVDNNKSEAARLLGIDRNTLSRYVKQARKLGARPPEGGASET
jgi:DNA-binding NtrC family response regulator